MTKDKKDQWVAHALSVGGIVVWVGIALLYPRIQGIVAIMLLFTVPVTIYNIVREALCKGPVCPVPATLDSIIHGTQGKDHV